MGTDGTRVIVQRLEAGLVVTQVCMYHGNHLARVDRYVDGSDTVAGAHDHIGLAVRRHLGQIDIVHALEVGAV
jgi:hypothetical protein